MHVQFIDLTTTIYVKRGLFYDSTKLRTVLDFFTDDWSREKISINGFPVRKEELDASIGSFGVMNLQIEQYK